MHRQLLNILICPVCQNSLEANKAKLTCLKCGKQYPIVEGIPVFTHAITDSKTKFSMGKFHELYNEGKDTNEELRKFALKKIKEPFPMEKYLKSLPDKKHGKYLELGIGGSIAINILAKKGYTIFGIDFSLASLKLSRIIAEIYKIPCFLICADIAHPPIKANTFDIIYGGGTLEHIEETQVALKNLYTITRQGGIIINTVPVVSISSLTYRQLSGNIPDIPILKQFFYFMHKKVFKTKFMFTGYEKSFLPSTIKRMHKIAGYSKARTFRYDFTPQLPHFPKKIKPLLQKIEKLRMFWTAINVEAKKI